MRWQDVGRVKSLGCGVWRRLPRALYTMVMARFFLWPQFLFLGMRFLTG